MAEILELCAAGDIDEARYTASLLHADLGEKLARYTDALEAHGIPRPFYEPPEER